MARRDADPASSYVARLLNGPREHAARKVGEEATEVLLAVPGSDEQIGEVADLVFHALVLVARDGRDPLDVFGELARRHEASRRSGEARVGVLEVALLGVRVARRAQVAAPRAAARGTRRASSQTQNVGRCAPSSGHGSNAGASSPALAQTVSHSSFSLRQVETSRK